MDHRASSDPTEALTTANAAAKASLRIGLQQSSALSHDKSSAKCDRRARSSPKQPHQSTTPLIRQRAHDRSPNIGLHMLYSSYSSGSQEVHKDEHINVDEVSDPSIVNQDLPPKRRRLFRLSQIARGPAKLRWTQQDSALLRWWPEFAGCRGQSPSGCCSTFGTADDWHR